MNQQITQLVIPNAGQQFKSKDFNDLLKPGVYVLLKDKRPIYVGMGKNALRRASGLHHKRHLFEKSDTILFYPCVNIQAAKDLELLLISGTQPAGNKQRKYETLRQRLGLSKTTAIVTT